MYSTFLVFRQLLEITTVTLQRAIKTNYMCFFVNIVKATLAYLIPGPFAFGRVFTYCLAMYLLLL